MLRTQAIGWTATAAIFLAGEKRLNSGKVEIGINNFRVFFLLLQDSARYPDNHGATQVRKKKNDTQNKVAILVVTVNWVLLEICPPQSMRNLRGW